MEIGCGTNTKQMDIQPDKSKVDAQKDRPILYCWFVEDNGTRRSGYALMDTRVGRPLLPEEPLFPTLEDVRRELKNQEGNPPVVIPKRPDWVPQVWKVRDLNTKEASQLGISERSWP
jgi:hypothetical protein